MWTSRQREVPERVAIYLTSELGLVQEKQAGLCRQVEGTETEGKKLGWGSRQRSEIFNLM